MGLLDALNSDEGMQALGLLAAAGPSATPMSFGQRLFGAMQQDQARRTEAEDRKMRQQMQQMQMQQLMEAAAGRKKAAEQEQQRASYLDAIDSSQGPPMQMSVPRALASGLSLPEIGALMPQQTKGPEFKVVGGRLVRIQGDDVREAYAAPEKPDAPPTSFREYTQAQQDPAFASWLEKQASLKAPKAPVVNMYNTDSAKAETDLRKEFADIPQVKRFNAALPAYKAIEDAASRNNPQSDINLVYGIAKLYDPESVVREGEYGTIAGSQSIPEKIKGYAQYLAGGGRLTEQTKQQLLVEARGRINSFKTEHDAARKTYEGIATRRKLDPQNVFITPSDLPKPPDSPMQTDIQRAAAEELRQRRLKGQ